MGRGRISAFLNMVLLAFYIMLIPFFTVSLDYITNSDHITSVTLDHAGSPGILCENV